MAYTSVLEALLFGDASSTLAVCTKHLWRNGKRGGLKIPDHNGLLVRVQLGVPMEGVRLVEDIVLKTTGCKSLKRSIRLPSAKNLRRVNS